MKAWMRKGLMTALWSLSLGSAQAQEGIYRLPGLTPLLSALTGPDDPPPLPSSPQVVIPQVPAPSVEETPEPEMPAPAPIAPPSIAPPPPITPPPITPPVILEGPAKSAAPAALPQLPPLETPELPKEIKGPETIIPKLPEPEVPTLPASVPAATEKTPNLPQVQLPNQLPPSHPAGLPEIPEPIAEKELPPAQVIQVQRPLENPERTQPLPTVPTEDGPSPRPLSKIQVQAVSNSAPSADPATPPPGVNFLNKPGQTPAEIAVQPQPIASPVPYQPPAETPVQQWQKAPQFPPPMVLPPSIPTARKSPLQKIKKAPTASSEEKTGGILSNFFGSRNRTETPAVPVSASEPATSGSGMARWFQRKPASKQPAIAPAFPAHNGEVILNDEPLDGDTEFVQTTSPHPVVYPTEGPRACSNGSCPPGVYPPGVYPPGVYPPGAYPTGVYPTGAISGLVSENGLSQPTPKGMIYPTPPMPALNPEIPGGSYPSMGYADTTRVQKDGTLLVAPSGFLSWSTPDSLRRPGLWMWAEFHALQYTRMTSPPLLTTGPANALNPAALGDPGTQVLFGSENFEKRINYAGRFGLGIWFPHAPEWGLDGSYFYLVRREAQHLFGSNGDPVLAHPYFNLAPGNEGEATFIVANGTQAIGQSAIHYFTEMYSADGNLRHRWFCGKNFWLDSLAGYRYFQLQDHLGIDDNITLGPGSLRAGDRFVVKDLFVTRNEFHGGQIGVESGVRIFRCFFAEASAKVAIGNMLQVVEVSGNTTYIPTNGGIAVAENTGIYAQPSNIGQISKSRIAIFPEFTAKFGYELTSFCKMYVGYNVTYISSVLRAGNQIDRTVNTTQSPAFVPNAGGPGAVVVPGALFGQSRPNSPLIDSEFWRSGAFLGVEFHF